MSITGVRRLTREQRRAQLLAIGVDLVATSSFDAVSIDQVAAEAGISRTLLFHYFPTKRDFQVAVAEEAAAQMLAATAPDPALPVAQRLRQGLEAFVDYVSSRREAFLSLVRGASGGDAALQRVFDHAHRVVAERLLVGLGVDGDDVPALLGIAVRGWIAFAEEAVVVWLAEGGTGRSEVVALLEHTLLTVIDAADDTGELLAAVLADERGA